MFKGKYYKNKFVYTDDDNIHTLCESNFTFDGLEFFMYKPVDDSYEIYLKDAENFYNLKGKITSLSEFLTSNYYDEIDFINPFGRTQKIITAIERINRINHSVKKLKK